MCTTTKRGLLRSKYHHKQQKNQFPKTEFIFNLSYEYYEYVQICILHLCITLSLKNHTIRYLHTNICQLRLSTISLTTKWDSKWLLLDDKSNPYIDENKISRKLVVG